MEDILLMLPSNRKNIRVVGAFITPQILDYKDNYAFKGKYGDPIGVYNFSSPDQVNTNKWRKALQQKKYREYLNGYGYFLGNKFLAEYGYEDGTKYHKSVKFKLFHYYCTRRVFVKSSNIKDKLASVVIRKYFGEKI